MYAERKRLDKVRVISGTKTFPGARFGRLGESRLKKRQKSSICGRGGAILEEHNTKEISRRSNGVWVLEEGAKILTLCPHCNRLFFVEDGSLQWHPTARYGETVKSEVKRCRWSGEGVIRDWRGDKRESRLPKTLS